MKFPCNSNYDSVFSGVEIEIHIVDHCNLNCAGCNHFSCLAEPSYIDYDYYVDQIALLAEKIPTVERLLILGGEPTLHPCLLDICKASRKLLPNSRIAVLTNGVDLRQVNLDAEEYKKNDIFFLIGEYNINHNEDFKQVLKKEIGSITWGKDAFYQTLVDPTGSQDPNQFFRAGCHHRLPCFTLRDYKVYECPFSAHLEIFCKKFNIDIPDIEDSDYLDLHTLTLEKLEQFSYQPKNRCKYCKQGEFWCWHPSDKSLEEFTEKLSDMYFSNYQRYEKIINTHKPFLNTELLEDADPDFGKGPREKAVFRFLKSKIDIIIPYYNLSIYTAEKLIEELLSQSIIKDCCIYFISDNSPNEKETIHILKKARNQLNMVFLKNEEHLGPGAARNKGIQNSFGEYLFFLDADDGFANSQVLEKLYNFSKYFDYQVVKSFKIASNNIKTKIENFFCNRTYIINNNIHFGKWLTFEDAYFGLLLKILDQDKIINYDLDTIMYNKNIDNKNIHLLNKVSKDDNFKNKLNSIKDLAIYISNNNLSTQNFNGYINSIKNNLYMKDIYDGAINSTQQEYQEEILKQIQEVLYNGKV